MNKLREEARRKEGKEACPSLVIIDSQSVKTAPFVSEDKRIDGSKKSMVANVI